MKAAPKPGALRRFLATTLVLALSWNLNSSIASANDEDFRTGVRAFEEGRYEDAERLFTSVLKENPGNEQALAYRDEAGFKFWVEVLARGGRLSTLARRILKRAEVASLKERQDEEKMRDMVNTMLSTESYIEQYTMVEKLVSQHGHYVVPLMVDILGDTKEAEKRVRCIAFLKRLGDEGLLALLELLDSEVSLTRQNVCIVLGHIRDRRAVPALKREVEVSKDSYVRSAATKALEAMPADGKATDAYLVLAEAYYKEHPLVMANPYKDWVVWKWRGSRLTRRLVQRFAWNEQVAEELCYDGLGVDGNDRRLWATLVNVTAMQWNEVNESLRVSRQVEDRGGEIDEDMLSGLEQERTRLRKARMLLSSAGKQPLFDGLRKALEDNNASVAVTIIEALQDININGTSLPASGEVAVAPINNPGGLPGLSKANMMVAEPKKPAPAKPAPAKPAPAKPTPAKPAPAPTPQPAPKEGTPQRNRPRVSSVPTERRGFAAVGGVFPQATPAAAASGFDGSALCAALTYGDKRVRFAASMALARLNPKGAFANLDKVMENLAEAVTQTGQRVVLVVEPNNNLRNEIVGLCRKLGYMAFGVASGNDALFRAKRFPAQDLIIVSSELNKDGAGDEPLEFQFAREIRDDYRTRPIKIMVLCPSSRESEMQGLVDADESVVGVVTPGIDKLVLREKIQAVFDSDEAKRDEKSRADKVSENAALAIASLKDKTTLFKVEQTADALVGNLNGRPDAVRIAAMRGLACLGTSARGKAMPVLLDVFKKRDENSSEVRVAAAEAIGACIRGQTIQGDAYQTLRAALGEDDTAVWTAAGTALGKALLDGAQRYQIYLEQRLSDSGSID